LKDFLDNVLEAEGIEMTFGGHRDAVGISRLDDVDALRAAIEKHKGEMERMPSDEQLVLKLSPAEIGSSDVLQKIMALEPIGTGLKLPPIVVEGIPRHKEATRLSGNPNWKKLFIAVPKEPTANEPKPKDVSVSLNDWSYSQESYPVDASKKVKFLASLELNDYRGLHVEASPIFDRSFLQERTQELQEEKQKPAKAKKASVDRE
ncbi:MAG: hypothetical protein IJV66_05370, partial [Firmicutes bacterium]|nr:hypothetical protein [Bacillota bacterium]